MALSSGLAAFISSLLLLLLLLLANSNTDGTRSTASAPGTDHSAPPPAQRFASRGAGRRKRLLGSVSAGASQERFLVAVAVSVAVDTGAGAGLSFVVVANRCFQSTSGACNGICGDCGGVCMVHVLVHQRGNQVQRPDPILEADSGSADKVPQYRQRAGIKHVGYAAFIVLFVVLPILVVVAIVVLGLQLSCSASSSKVPSLNVSGPPMKMDSGQVLLPLV